MCLCRSRTAQLRGRVGGNSSRPASLHVDNYEKAASLATPPTLTLALKPSAITNPSPAGLSSLRSGSLTPRETTTPTTGNALAPGRLSASTPGIATAALAPSPVVSAATASDISPRASAQQSMLGRAVKPEIKQDPSLPTASSAMTLGFRTAVPNPPTSVGAATQGSAGLPQPAASTTPQPTSAPQRPASSTAPHSLPQSASLGQAAGATVNDSTAAAASMQHPARSSPISQPMQQAELIEVDPFADTDMVSSFSAAASQRGQPDHSLSVAGSNSSRSPAAAAAAVRLALQASAGEVSAGSGIPSTSATLQVLPTEATQLPAPAQLQPPVIAAEEEAVDIYSDFGQDASTQQTSQPSTSQRNANPNPASLVQRGSGVQQSPSASPELLRRTSSTAQAATAAATSTGPAAGLSHRDPRRSSGSSGSRPTRDPRQSLATAAAPAADVQNTGAAQGMPAASMPVAPVRQPSQQPTPAAMMTPAAELLTQSSGASAARQTPGTSTARLNVPSAAATKQAVPAAAASGMSWT